MSIEPGKSYLFMTVTHYFTGEVVAITPTQVVLKTCAWIPDTGRLHQAFITGQFTEVEPCPDGTIVPLGGTTIFPWAKPLPTAAK